MSVRLVKIIDPTAIVTGGLVPKGAYSGGTAYSVGDSVSYNGSSYVCITASTGNLPTDTAYWQLVASKGDTGPTGPAGTTDYNELDNLPTLGTAAAKDIPATGNASATEVVYGTDTRLTDSRPASDVSAWAKTPSKPTYNKSEVGLGNVDNTSDANKPVSTAQGAADALKVNKAGDTMTGTLTTTGIVQTSPVIGITSGATNNALKLSGGTINDGGTIVLNGSTAGSTGVLRVGSTDIAFWSTAHLSPSTNNTIALGSPTQSWSNVYVTQATIGGVLYVTGTGFPEGVTSAPVGSIYIDKAVTNGASSWIKKSGTGSTGWQVLEGDTGWRNVSSQVANGWAIASGGYIYVKRTSNGVSIRALGLNSSSSTSDTFLDLGASFGVGTGGSAVAASAHTVTAPATIYRSTINTAGSYYIARPGSAISVRCAMDTNSTAAWPTTLPGTAV